MRRALLEPEHRDLEESFVAFLAREVRPHFHEWEQRGAVPRELFRTAGAAGFLAFEAPPEHGGAGVQDFRFNAIIGEAAHRAGFAGVGAGITLHNDVCLPYFVGYSDSSQRERWLPGIVSGELITAIALTEPGAGSDLAAIATRADRVDGGYLVNGSKTFITNGINAALIITAVRTDATDRHGGLSLVVVEDGADGLRRGRNLEKIGMHSQDTAELFFDDLFVPVENLLGAEGQGFRQLVSNLPRERLSIAVAGVAAAEAVIAHTVEYVRSRRAFGASLGSLQATRFALAELTAETSLVRAFVDRGVDDLNAGNLSPEDAAVAKWRATELQGWAADRCLQLHGGYGYMLEYPVARAFLDARVTRIYGGANEVMKEIVGRSLEL
ncbi:MAG: acyl-CoA dehydrogenase [Mycobacterium sp.]|nr:acyl-CoA dehydrogenase [Mycobacterium sp.]